VMTLPCWLYKGTHGGNMVWIQIRKISITQ
jgi:hypothetical protein